MSAAGPRTTCPPLPRRRETDGGPTGVAVDLGLHAARGTCRPGEPEICVARPIDTTTRYLETHPTGSESPATAVETGPRRGDGRAHDVGDKAPRIAEHEEHTATLAQPCGDTPGVASTHPRTRGDDEIDTVGHGGQHRRELCCLDSGHAEHPIERNPPLCGRRESPARPQAHESYPGTGLRGSGSQRKSGGPSRLPLASHNSSSSQAALGEHLGER